MYARLCVKVYMFFCNAANLNDNDLKCWGGRGNEKRASNPHGFYFACGHMALVA